MVQLGDCASILISHWWDFLGESYVMIVMTAVIFCVCISSAYFYHHSNIKSKWTYVLGNHNGTDVFKVTAFFVYVLTHFLFSMTPIVIMTLLMMTLWQQMTMTFFVMNDAFFILSGAPFFNGRISAPQLHPPTSSVSIVFAIVFFATIALRQYYDCNE